MLHVRAEPPPGGNILYMSSDLRMPGDLPGRRTLENSDKQQMDGIVSVHGALRVQCLLRLQCLCARTLAVMEIRDERLITVPCWRLTRNTVWTSVKVNVRYLMRPGDSPKAFVSYIVDALPSGGLRRHSALVSHHDYRSAFLFDYADKGLPISPA